MKRHLLTFCLGSALAGTVLAAPEEFASPTISIGVVVSDLQKSVEFYTEVVGMTRTGQFSVDEKFSKQSGLADGLPIHVTVLKLGEDKDATQWKLMTFGDRARSHRSRHICDQTGVQYVTILVKDLTPILKRIREHHVKLLGETPIPLGTDRHFALIQDPDGTFIELIGPMK